MRCSPLVETRITSHISDASKQRRRWTDYVHCISSGWCLFARGVFLVLPYSAQFGVVVSHQQEEPSMFVPPRFCNAEISILRPFRLVFEDISEKNEEFVDMDTFEAFMNFKVN